MLINSSLDILFIALSISVIVLTGLLAYLLFYTGQTVRMAYLMMQEIQEKVTEVAEMIDTIHGKVTALSGVATDIYGVITKVIERRKK